ncbi:sel1 repeat family protein [Pseudomonas sp. L5B5]|uniref:sel1 repeat family protein n=1 Tax=Pseudomonas sp. L5B5 TaxID=2883205 RepID=UPI001CFA31F7|nr:sel1 repeat family protein [Pseudomonas sp. L5B5]UCZ86073.1 sel1 repeat family protein [Pseudomonas sp. L5B5]
MRPFYFPWLLAMTLLPTWQALAAPAPATPAEAVSTKVLAQPQWQSLARQCPATLVPRREAPTEPDRCSEPEQMEGCLQSCKRGDGNDCYWLGINVQKAKGPAMGYEPLFQRACTLGVVSGCTNRAAGMYVATPDDEPVRQCVTKTYAKVCELGDPWACTMYGFNLSQGIGTTTDNTKALKVLDRSCNKHGTEDPACTAAIQLQQKIQDKLAAPKP